MYLPRKLFHTLSLTLLLCVATSTASITTAHAEYEPMPYSPQPIFDQLWSWLQNQSSPPCNGCPGTWRTVGSRAFWDEKLATVTLPSDK